jgi:hypothetical protein
MSYKVSQESFNLSLSLDKFILNPAFVRNFRYGTNNPNFYFNYGYICGRAFLILITMWTVFGMIYSRIGFKILV